MKTRLTSVLFPACLVALSFGATAQAAIISGTLNITGSVGVTSTQIDFNPAGTGIGAFGVDPFSQTGSFSAIAGTAGSSRDLTIGVQPVNAPFLFPMFLTFAASPGLRFDLTFIQQGAGSPAACAAAPAGGQVCSLPGSPFTLTNGSPTSSTASFNVRGTVTDGTASPASTFVGTYSTQFPTQSYQDVLAQLGSAGRVNASYSATFTVTSIPEPGTVALLVSGSLLLLVGGYFRRRQNS